MLLRAADHFSEGNNIVVVFANNHLAEHGLRWFCEMLRIKPSRRNSAKLNDKEAIFVSSKSMDNLRGLDHLIFNDHFTGSFL